MNWRNIYLIRNQLEPLTQLILNILQDPKHDIEKEKYSFHFQRRNISMLTRNNHRQSLKKFTE